MVFDHLSCFECALALPLRMAIQQACLGRKAQCVNTVRERASKSYSHVSIVQQGVHLGGSCSLLQGICRTFSCERRITCINARHHHRPTYLFASCVCTYIPVDLHDTMALSAHRRVASAGPRTRSATVRPFVGSVQARNVQANAVADLQPGQEVTKVRPLC